MGGSRLLLRKKKEHEAVPLVAITDLIGCVASRH
jgi:hypothetical protein